MNAKIVLCAITLLVAVLICGCTTTSQQTTAVAAGTPDLVGNWSGTMVGYVDGAGYTDFSGCTLTMSVTEQQDRVFSGTIAVTNKSGFVIRDSSPCAGVIGRDGATFTLIEHDGGYSSGSVLAPDEIEIVHVDGDEPITVAIDSLKRSKTPLSFLP